MADDGSDPPPESVVAAFRDRIDVSLVTQPHAGPATARNTGAARARGKLLAFTDDDCAPAPDWLRVLADAFSAKPDCAIGGRTVNVLFDNPYSSASQLLIDYLYTYYNAVPDQASFLTSNNMALPADRFHALGGFDRTFPRAAGEDRDFCDRWRDHGYSMIYAPKAVVYHSHRLTLRTFWRQHFVYGRGSFHFHQARALRRCGLVRLERASFYLNLLRYPFLQVHGVRAIQLACLMVASQAANAAGFYWEGRSDDKRSSRQAFKA